MLLAVNLIVRDEAARLVDCLDSVRDLADEVVVYDTGSTDETVSLARAAGASVVEGYWQDDFSRARNAALTVTSATWVLALDADERWVGDAGSLRRFLLDAPQGEGLAVLVRNSRDRASGGDYTHRALRLFRRVGSAWSGRVHEAPGGPQIRSVSDLPEAVGSLLHLGYDDPELRRRKGARNADLAQAELDRLVAAGCDDADVVAPVLLDLGRSLLAAGRGQHAVDCFEAVRDLLPGSTSWVQATDFLARLLLGAGEPGAALVLAEQLRSAGAADGQYCDWLRAAALLQLGDAAGAARLLDRVHSLVDTQGRQADLAPVLELRELARALRGAA